MARNKAETPEMRCDGQAVPRPFTSADRPPPRYPDDHSVDREALFLLDTFGVLALNRSCSFAIDTAA